MKRLHVVAGIIVDDEGRILIARRPDHVHQGGLWEFPGGKCEPGEAPEAALARELGEELGITISRFSPFRCIAHDYADKQVLLDFWWVDGFSGEPSGAEGQQVRWVERASLGDYDFPAANEPVVAVLMEPGLMESRLAESDR